MACRNIKLILAYDGTGYRGWQSTMTGVSVEGVLRKVLEKILQHSVLLQAASRTDAGVHAVGQVVNFFTTHPRLCLKRLKHSLNSLLPPSIQVLHVEEAPPAFHPTLDCQGKEYHYWLCHGTTQLPQNRLYSWYYPCSLNLVEMTVAAEELTGSHDFTALCNTRKGDVYADYTRTIYQIHIGKMPDSRLLFKICGNHFLYKMVRNIVGTLVYIGMGRISSKNLTAILASRKREKAGITAPAHGLTLYRIWYTNFLA